MTNFKRVVVTGMGIVSSIGNNTEEVKESLINKKSGIVEAEAYKEMGFRSQIHGAIRGIDTSTVTRASAGQLVGSGDP